MNTLLDNLIAELEVVTKKYSENDNIKVSIPQLTENNLKIQIQFDDRNEFDISFNTLAQTENRI
nr:hypothetical protein [uncultured Moellerella sp.]